MRHRVLLLVTCVCLVPLLFASELTQRLATDLQAALEVEFPETPTLQLYDALVRLSEKPDSVADWTIVRQGATAQEDSSLAALLDALLTLDDATTGNLEGYRKRLLTLRKTTDNARLLELLNVSNTLIPCAECGGGKVCKSCNGALKCPTCKGRGSVTSRTSSRALTKDLGSRSLKAASAPRMPCRACGGSGQCATCKGVRNTCATCRNRGRVPDPQKLASRVAQVAKLAQERMDETCTDALEARRQTALLAATLLKVKQQADTAEALAVLKAEPEARVVAAQWSHAATVRADLEAILQERTTHSAEKEAARTALRAAVAQAQRAQDPLQGLAQIVPLFTEYADCDALPEAKAAFEGLVAAEWTRQETQARSLSEQLARIKAVSMPQDRVALLEACLAEWPMASIPKTLREYATSEKHTALKRILEASHLATLKTQAETLLAVAEKAVQAEVEAKPNLWIWAGGGVVALVILYVLWSLIQGMLERRAEAARKARQQAALESIRNTFSHRRGH